MHWPPTIVNRDVARKATDSSKFSKRCETGNWPVFGVRMYKKTSDWSQSIVKNMRKKVQRFMKL